MPSGRYEDAPTFSPTSDPVASPNWVERAVLAAALGAAVVWVGGIEGTEAFVLAVGDRLAERSSWRKRRRVLVLLSV